MRIDAFALWLMLVSTFLLAGEVEPTASDAVDQQIRLLQESEMAWVRRDPVRKLKGKPGREINEFMLQALIDRYAAERSAPN